MKSIELIIQVKKIESIIDTKEIETTHCNKTVLDFDISSYSNTKGINPSSLRKESNKLIAYGNISDFVSKYINEDDYLLVKGDLREISSNENILLPLTINKVGHKNITIKSTDSIINFKL